MSRDPRSQSEIPGVMESVCVTRMDLLDQLAKAVEKLGRAKLNLRRLLDGKGSTPLHFLTNEVEQLRTDCGVIRAELEYHRSSHGC